MIRLTHDNKRVLAVCEVLEAEQMSSIESGEKSPFVVVEFADFQAAEEWVKGSGLETPETDFATLLADAGEAVVIRFAGDPMKDHAQAMGYLFSRKEYAWKVVDGFGFAAEAFAFRMLLNGRFAPARVIGDRYHRGANLGMKLYYGKVRTEPLYLHPGIVAVLKAKPKELGELLTGIDLV